MEKCRLCKKNIADKTKTHIVPHFLLKRFENIEGKSGRDYELSFHIKEFDMHSYFGRSLQPEELEDIYGKIADEEIDKNHHPLIVDNFFCSRCERRFSIIESRYAKTMVISDEKEYISGVKSELGLLFWMSVFWRMSINKKSGAHLSKGENEILRRILNRLLTDSVESVEVQRFHESKDLNKISYKVLRSSNYSINNATGLFFDPKFRNPYTLLIDEFIILFSLKNKYNDFKSRDFYGLKGQLFAAKTNQVGGNETVFVIDSTELKLVYDGVFNHLKDKRMIKYKKFFDKVHNEMGGKGKSMPKRIINEIMAELVSNEKKIGRKFTSNDLVDSTHKVMQKYFSS